MYSFFAPTTHPEKTAEDPTYAANFWFEAKFALENESPTSARMLLFSGFMAEIIPTPTSCAASFPASYDVNPA